MPLGQGTQMYQTLAGRLPDVGGLKYWSDRAAAGESWEDLSAEFAGTNEAQRFATTGQQRFVAPEHQIEGLDYKTNLGVAPTTYMPTQTGTLSFEEMDQKWQEIFNRPLGKEGWLAYKDSNKSMEELEAEWRASEEGQNIAAGGQPVVVDPYGGSITADDIIQGYQQVLGRAPGKAGLEFYLNSGLSKEEFLAQIAAEPEGLDYARTGQQRYVDPSQQYAGVDYRYNVDPSEDPYAATTRGETGLTGAEDEYQRALYASQKGLGEFADVLDPWAKGGEQAYDVQLALSGALGPDAQAEAYKNYKDSPGQDWLKEESMRQIENYAAATGQSLGGNVLDEINRRAMGLAMQDYGAQFERLGSLSKIGGGAANILSQGYLGSGQFDANIMARMGDIRYQAGRDIAEGLGQSTTALSGLQERQGIMDAETYAFGAGKISIMISDVAKRLNINALQLGMFMANLTTNQASKLTGFLTKSGDIKGDQDAAFYEAAGNIIQGLFEAGDE